MYSNVERLWLALHNLILPKATSWIYDSGVDIWRGQEHEIAQEIADTAIEKALRYIDDQQALGVVVHSPEGLGMKIAKNHFLDRRRHEKRLQRFSLQDYSEGGQLSVTNLIDPSEEAEERVYEDWIFIQIAAFIPTLAQKTREAVLMNMANLGAENPVFIRALLDNGIRLHEYLRPLPDDPQARAQLASLRSQGFAKITKRIRLLLELGPA